MGHGMFEMKLMDRHLIVMDANLYECEKLGVKMEKQRALEIVSSNRRGQNLNYILFLVFYTSCRKLVLI